MIWVWEALVGGIMGVVVSGGIFAFIVVIGIVPRLIQRTQTAQYILLYESMIMLGGVAAGLTLLGPYFLKGFLWAEVVVGGSYGIFLGCLSVALAEVINVLPILCRRMKLASNLPWLLLVMALGKTLGVLAYYFIPGFLNLE